MTQPPSPPVTRRQKDKVKAATRKARDVVHARTPAQKDKSPEAIKARRASAQAILMGGGTIAEAAKAAQVGVRTVKGWLEDGHITSLKKAVKAHNTTTKLGRADKAAKEARETVVRAMAQSAENKEAHDAGLPAPNLRLSADAATPDPHKDFDAEVLWRYRKVFTELMAKLDDPAHLAMLALSPKDLKSTLDSVELLRKTISELDGKKAAGAEDFQAEARAALQAQKVRLDKLFAASG